ncbi:MAG TPA: DUF4421 family protein [Bacteroidia bacterium]|nr:DUF4421 family protein [Bacteroidia bacterium]
MDTDTTEEEIEVVEEEEEEDEEIDEDTLADSQEDTVRYLQTGRYDTAYIEKFPDLISVEPWISIPNFQFIIEPSSDSIKGFRTRYLPYMRAGVGFDGSYRAVSFSLGIRGPVEQVDQDLYGKSEYTNFNLRINSNPVIYEFYYNKITGFSDRNTRTYDSLQPKETPYIKRPDITLQYIKAKVIYIFSERQFSYGAAYGFSERQRKSKATALLVAHAYRMKTDADSAFFNRGQESFFGKYDKMKHLDVLSVGAGPGLAATLVHKKWFFSFGLYAMLDIQYHHANDGEVLISEGWRAAVLGDGFLSMGYNGDRFYAGLVARGDKNMVSLPFVTASTTFTRTLLCFGFRFDPPKWLGSVYDKSPLKYF